MNFNFQVFANFLRNKYIYIYKQMNFNFEIILIKYLKYPNKIDLCVTS